MTKHIRAGIGMVVAAVLLLQSSTARATSYTCSILYPAVLPANWGSDLQPTGSDIGGGEVVQTGFGPATGDVLHALLWTQSGTFVDLNPSTFESSSADATNGGEQVGYVQSPVTAAWNAALWLGTADSVVDLNPSGYQSSLAMGTNGAQQVGIASGVGTGLKQHAMLWSSTAASAVDLDPTTLAGFTATAAEGVGGTEQVGEGDLPAVNGIVPTHALLWTGTAASAVDLNPSGFDSSNALGTNGSEQVGNGYGSATNGDQHALLWSGTNASVVDLNPAGYLSSSAYSMNLTQEVGYAYVSLGGGDTSHAMVWSGTAGSDVDLSNLLPASGSWQYSEADQIDTSGNIFGVAHGNYSGNTASFAVEWSPTVVPEPSQYVLWAVPLIAILCRRRRRPDWFRS